jgi:hypothetical protein
VGLFFVLGCGLGFVWLLLWLWERLFNIGCELYPIGCGFEREKRISNPSSSAKKTIWRIQLFKEGYVFLCPNVQFKGG